MSKPLSHEIDVYGAWIHLARTRAEWKKLRRTVKGMDPKPSDAAGATSFLSFTAKKRRAVAHYVVWIDVNAALDEIDMLDTIAHEATHVGAHLLFDHAGQKQDGDSEALAYLIGWVTAWIWQGCALRD